MQVDISKREISHLLRAPIYAKFALILDFEEIVSESSKLISSDIQSSCVRDSQYRGQEGMCQSA